MYQAHFYFYGNLNYFLNHDLRWRDFCYAFKGTPSIKHLIEALHVPHTEVGQIIVNNQPVDLRYLVQENDRIKVYPIEQQTIEAANQTGTKDIEAPRFILDSHLGRLATYLRMLGIDACYRNDFQDDELARIADLERRILLTRDRRLLMRNIITDGCCIRSLDPREQLKEVIRRFKLLDYLKPFHRCLKCNAILSKIEKQMVYDQLMPLTRIYYDEFCICTNCNQIYWKGSHFDRMNELLRQIFLDFENE